MTLISPIHPYFREKGLGLFPKKTFFWPQNTDLYFLRLWVLFWYFYVLHFFEIALIYIFEIVCQILIHISIVHFFEIMCRICIFLRFIFLWDCLPYLYISLVHISLRFFAVFVYFSGSHFFEIVCRICIFLWFIFLWDCLPYLYISLVYISLRLFAVFGYFSPRGKQMPANMSPGAASAPPSLQRTAQKKTNLQKHKWKNADITNTRSLAPTIAANILQRPADNCTLTEKLQR